MKLILGTVQLGLDYGIGKKKPSLKESLNILNYAIDNNIMTFDTAQGYGNSELILSNISDRNVRIITKISFDENTYSYIHNKVIKSINNLGINKIDTLLLHKYKDFENEILINNLVKIKSNNLICKLGVSVYTVEEAITVLKNSNFNLLQIPFNYLDNQWNNQEFQKLISKKEIEIHVRSIFLQGILVNDFKYWPKIDNFDLRYIYNSINLLCKKYNVTKVELVVGFIKSIKWIDGVIFGVDNIKQLEENVKIFSETRKFKDNEINEIKEMFSNIPKKLINPSLWS